jgi:hypothetical protein
MELSGMKIYYTGIGDTTDCHLYTPNEFMKIMHNNKHRFILTYNMPTFDPETYTMDDLANTVCWSGALVEFGSSD